MAGKSIIDKKTLLKIAIKMVEKDGIESINARDLAANAGISWTEPISLFAVMIETNRVSELIYSDRVPTSTVPVQSTGR